jgi:hypothetical protein
MSTLKTDAIEAATGTNTDLSLDGKGSGVPDLGAGFKVGSVAGVPTASIRDDAVTTAKILNDNVTLAKLAAGTDGELITWDASGDPATVAVGTATHVLTSNGAGAAPTFQAAAGGGAWTKISTSEAGGGAGVASMTFTGIAVASYECYALVLSRFQPINDQADLWIRIGSGGTPATSGYNSQNVYNGTANTGVTSAIELTDSVRSSTDGTGVGIAWIHPFLTDSVTSIFGQFYSPSSANIQSIFGGALPATGDAIDRIEILFDTGNIKYGRATLYGIAGHVA